MSDDPTTDDVDREGTTTSTEDQAAGDAEARSPLVGFMSVPVSRRFPMRRSTFIMLVAFVGFGILLWQYPPQGDATSGTYIRTSDGNSYFCPGCTKVTPSPTTSTTTTTTVPSPSTTTSTTPSSSSTTTTRGSSPVTSTSTTSTSTTTTTTTLGSTGGSTTTTAPTTKGEPTTTSTTSSG